jgi:hypothetical protein
VNLRTLSFASSSALTSAAISIPRLTLASGVAAGSVSNKASILAQKFLTLPDSSVSALRYFDASLLNGNATALRDLFDPRINIRFDGLDD